MIFFISDTELTTEFAQISLKSTIFFFSFVLDKIQINTGRATEYMSKDITNLFNIPHKKYPTRTGFALSNNNKNKTIVFYSK